MGVIMLIQTEITISSAHYVHTIKSKCQRLHGHNWKVVVSVDADISENGMVIDFSDIKNVIKKCDHKILIPEKANHIIHCPCIIKHDDKDIKLDNHILIYRTDDEEKYYILPQKDVEIIPVSVISVEKLAEYFAKEISFMITNGRVEVNIWETEKNMAKYTFNK